MEKKYIVPETEVVEMEVEQVIAMSRIDSDDLDYIPQIYDDDDDR